MSPVDRPNVVLIVLDTVRARNLRSYGYARDTMPFLERFVAGSTLYANALSPSPWTLPAHASLFTGLYPSQHGATELNRFLSPEVPVLAEILAASGYETFGLSANSWISNTFGTSRGFQRFFKVWQLVQSEIDLHKADLAGKMARAKDAVRQLRRGRPVANALNGLFRRFFLDRYDYGARRINNEVAGWAEARPRAGGGRGRQPFFLFVNFMEAHLKYWAPRRWRSVFLPPGTREKRAAGIDQDPWAHLTGASRKKTSEDWAILEALYDGELRYLDFRLCELFGALESRGLLDGTLVVVTSDHGENIGEHGMMDHQYCLYDTLLRVPLVVRYPDAPTTGGPRIDERVQTLDVFPTILENAGLDLPSGWTDWRSRILPRSGREGAGPGEARPIVAEYLGPEPPIERLEIRHPPFRGAHLDRRLRCIYSSDGWKYIDASDGRNELYRIDSDAAEQSNLAAAHADVCVGLGGELERWTASLTERKPTGEAPEMDEAVRKRLESLGYL